MIHDANKKLLVLLPPKTGSHTLRILFKSIYGLDIPKHFYSHIRYDDIANILTDINLDEYTIYGFYREPVARFMSTFKYFQHIANECIKLTIRARDEPEVLVREPEGGRKYNQHFYAKKLTAELNLAYKTLYNDESCFPVRDAYVDITIDVTLNGIQKETLSSILDLFCPQTLYLTDKVTLLDFEDFDNNVKMLLEVFGLDSNILIPRENATNSAEYLSDLTEEQITKIKQIYAVDYAFFESRNITF